MWVTMNKNFQVFNLFLVTGIPNEVFKNVIQIESKVLKSIDECRFFVAPLGPWDSPTTKWWPLQKLVLTRQ